METIKLIGWFLLAVCIASGASLFFAALGASEKFKEGSGMATLWALFIIGLIGAVIIFAVT